MRRGRRFPRGLLLLLPFVAVAAPAHPQTQPFVLGDLGAGTVELLFGADAFDGTDVRGFCLLFEDLPRRPTYASVRGRGFGVSRALLEVTAAGRSTRYEIDVPSNVSRVCIPCPGLSGFVPQRLRLSWVGAASAGRTLKNVEPLRASAGAPIPAELGAMLSFLPEQWRQPRYEVFRWTDEPAILIFDTASYEVQDRLFKRLAFFVEKKAYAGTIPGFQSIAGLHGFNAHDYRAEDLARFFSTADRLGIHLLSEEQELEGILLGAGVLRKENGAVRAGTGGVISISRSGTAELRTRLLTHEALHGLYFTSPGFRASVTAVWDGADEELRQFVRLYLSWPEWGYDLSNSYLLVNEFMAYLLQYTEDEMLSKLFESGITWLRERYPDRAAWLTRFGKSGRAEITAAYRALEELLWRELGVGGGRLVGLRPAR